MTEKWSYHFSVINQDWVDCDFVLDNEKIPKNKSSAYLNLYYVSRYMHITNMAQIIEQQQYSCRVKIELEAPNIKLCAI